MTRIEFEILCKNEVIKQAPLTKVAQALMTMEYAEGMAGFAFSYDEMEEYVESWLIADLDSNGNDPAWKSFLESLAK